MTFIWPWALSFLVLIPSALWLYRRSLLRRRTQSPELRSFRPSAVPVGLQWKLRKHLPHAYLLCALGILFLGLARPEMTVTLPRTEGTVVLAFDVSNSMGADDIEPTRLEAAKEAARQLVERQPPAVRLGVVAFGGSSLIVQVPTDDRLAVLDAIDRLSTQGGTSLGAGLFSSLNAIAGRALSIDAEESELDPGQYRIDDFSSAVVLLFTDGENTEAPDPEEISQLAAEAGVRVYSIGIGSAQGATIEVDGFSIMTQLDEQMLKDVANITNGTYYRGEDRQALLDFYDQVDLQLTQRGQSMEVTSLAAGLSAVLFLIGGGLSLLWFGRVP